MKTPKVYLESTVFNFYFADDAPDKRKDTLKLFDEIRQGKYEPYTSDIVLGELRMATGPKRDKMIALIDEHKVVVLPVDEETRRLATLYVGEGIIPPKYATDALHIASTTVNNLDYIISYNFQHIVKLKTITMTEIINLRERYKRIGIYSPTEVVDYEE